jgi:hypothetical protein
MSIVFGREGLPCIAPRKSAKFLHLFYGSERRRDDYGKERQIDGGRDDV